MSRQSGQLLNQLSVLLPESVVAPSEWLIAQGYSRQSLNKYKNNHWLDQPVKGVYVRSESPVTWQGALLGLQQLAELPFHMGGITALNQQGLAHYVPLGKEKIHLWGTGSLPAWVRKLPIAKDWVFHTRRLFEQRVNEVGLIQLPTKVRDWQITASSPERAILEVLSEVSQDQASFTAAAELMEGLTTLKPYLLNSLLSACRQVKTKRVFLFLAHYFNYPWLEGLDWKSLDLGSGKRLVVKNGKLDKQFNITVPEQFYVKQG